MNTDMPEARCPECGAPLSPGAAQGLCAHCLLAGAAAPAEHSAPSSTAPTLEQVAAAFPQLEVLALIGHGGMGAVFKVRQPKLDRFAALKLLPALLAADPAFASRFEREARLLARLNHANIVSVYDHGQAGEFFYLLMEFVDGVNLRQAMRASRFTPAQALGIVPKICDALQFAHEEGVLHRDIKPENILLDAKGRVKLADFGIAKLIGESGTGILPVIDASTGRMPMPLSSLTQSGSTLGTPSYMAPEQRDTPADVDHRADIYSLGVVFYELLTGELPRGSFVQPSAKSDADPRVDAIVRQAMEKERERRQGSAGEMRTQVETLASAAPVSPDESRMTSENVTRRFSRTAIVGAGWISFLVIAVLMMFIAYRVELPAGQTPPGPAWWQILLRFTLLPVAAAAPFGTTILGWIAVSQIRSSAGKICGLGLAVFDGLLFPLLALDYSICYFLNQLGIALHLWTQNYEPTSNAILTVLSFAACGTADFFVVRRVWWAVSRTSAGSMAEAFGQAPKPAVQKPKPRAGKMFAIGAAVLLVVLSVSFWIYVRLAEPALGSLPSATGTAEIESVVVTKEEAVVKQHRFAGEGMIITLGPFERSWTPGGLYLDAMFDITQRRTRFGNGVDWVIKSRHGTYHLYRLEGPPGAMLGKIVFHPGTPGARADGSYVIGEFKPQSAPPLPIAIKLAADGDQPSEPINTSEPSIVAPTSRETRGL